MQSTAILLAAGLSTRMGQAKPLLNWQGQPLVAYQVQQLRLAGIDELIVVTGNESEAVESALRDLDVCIARNVDFREGRATSVRAGALAVAGTPDAILLLNVDQPRHAAVIGALLEAHSRLGGSITQPSYAGRRGHPIVLAGRLLAELQAVDEATEGLRAVVRRHGDERRELPVDAAEVLVDLNDSEGYRRVLSSWQP